MEEKEFKKGQISHFKGVVNKFIDKADKALKDISNLKAQLLEGDTDNPGLIAELENAQSEVSQIQKKFLELDKTVFKNLDIKGRTLSERIDGFVDVFTKAEKDILEMRENIFIYNDELLGYENEEGEKISGIKQDIEQQVQTIQKLYDDNSTRQNKLFLEIESLLKGASTVALAKSFNEHKTSFDNMNWIWLGIFGFAIAILMGVSVTSFILTDYKIEDMWKYTLGNLPLLGGAIWLAIYASKQRSQNKRLQQEYAYKEDVAKIYYGLKKEVENMKDTTIGSKLNEQVLKTIMDVVAINPSETLDSKSHNDKGPVLESLENIKSIVSNINTPKI